jgi:hypothetical protein
VAFFVSGRNSAIQANVILYTRVVDSVLDERVKKLMKLHILLVGLILGISISACGLLPATNTTESTDQTGAAASALPPILVEIQGDELVATPPATMKVGEAFVFAGESAGWRIGTTTPDLVQVSQGGDQGTFTTNPGFIATAAGAAVVTATGPSGATITVNITIE